MITEAVCNWFLDMVATVIGWLPSWGPDAQAAVAGFDGHLTSLVAYVAKFDPIIPFDMIGVAAGILGVFATLAFFIQIARITVSFVTLGGGGV